MFQTDEDLFLEGERSILETIRLMMSNDIKVAESDAHGTATGACLLSLCSFVF